MFIIGFLQSLLHRVKQRNIASILRFDRHLGNIDDLLLDQVLLVDETQTPWLDKLIRELSMKEYTTLLYAPRDLGFESRL